MEEVLSLTKPLQGDGRKPATPERQAVLFYQAMATKKRFQSEALQYTYDKYIAGDPERVASYEQEVINVEVAKLIHDLRTKAGLSQRELAKRVGTTASVICRLEDADYEGHSLSMLKRIAAALARISHGGCGEKPLLLA
jgi:ribosome-binding protein aMBF1 (putative translation factor)